MNQPKKDLNFYGMYTEAPVPGVEPNPFETFKFFINTAPDSPFEIFNIPAHVMMHAGMSAGFKAIDYKIQYPHPDYVDNEVMRKYLDVCNGTDYVMKMKL